MTYVGIQTQQRRNNFKSTLLLFMFPCLILGLSWLFCYVFFGDGGTHQSYDEYSGRVTSYDMPTSTEAFIQAVPWIIGGCAIWFLIAYWANTSMINAATGSKPLERRENKRVYNLVENLCIANSMDMPKVNIIEDASLNAFASGINKKSYTVTLTRGIIDRLNDEELEGVIAHELTHIRNRDVKVLIVSIIFVGIFAYLTQMLMRSMMYSNISRRNNDNKGGAAIMMLVAMVLGIIGYFITMMMRFAISRNREYMADAGGAEMTKNPRALASALRKISGNDTVKSVTQSDVAQLFISNPLSGKKTASLASLFATHPPIEKRIQILEQF